MFPTDRVCKCKLNLLLTSLEIISFYLVIKYTDFMCLLKGLFSNATVIKLFDSSSLVQPGPCQEPKLCQ